MCGSDELNHDFIDDPYGEKTIINVPVKLTQSTYRLVDKMMKEEGVGLEVALTRCISERYFRINPCH